MFLGAGVDSGMSSFVLTASSSALSLSQTAPGVSLQSGEGRGGQGQVQEPRAHIQPLFPSSPVGNRGW